MTDPHFVFADNAADATIVWPTGLGQAGLDRPSLKAIAVNNSSYFNSFPFDEVLLLPTLMVQMVNNGHRHPANDNGQETLIIPESFLVEQQLPAFVGRFIERENSFQDNTWRLLPQGPYLHGGATVTNHVDWALKLTEAGSPLI